MTDQHDPEAVVRYAAAVRAAVADLRAEARAVLLEDLEAHLQEVAAEPGASLTERLGAPEAYAAELRAAYGAPAAEPPSPPAGEPRRAWRRRAARLLVPALVVIAIAGILVWRASTPAGEQWSVTRLQSEAAAGHVSQVTIEGNAGTATDRRGVQHTVQLPDITGPLASDLVSHGVNVVYQQQSSSPFLHPAWAILTLLLFVGVPLVVVGLLIGVLWRLYRRLGRPAGWADR